MNINCEYDKQSKCNNCKHKKQCTLTVPMTNDLQQTQNKIKELTDEIELLKKDINEWKTINRQIKAGYYQTQKNVRGEWITKPSHIINIPDIGFLQEELEEKSLELRLWQQKEVELMQKTME